jgi:hypothetical protein
MLLLEPFNTEVYPWSADGASLKGLPPLAFTPRTGFKITRTLAHMLDSLVRVSRRVNYKHFASILEASFNKKTPLVKRTCLVIIYIFLTLPLLPVTRESITPLTFYCKIATLPLCFLQSKNKAMLTCSTLSKKSFAIHYL